MKNLSNQKYKYQVGGTLRINRSVFYIERQADQELLQAIKAGEFCYVLNSRQMGKSSLAINTIKRLQSEDKGFACVLIDINILGSEVSKEQWYKGFADFLIDELELEQKIDLSQWWQQETLLSPVQKLNKLLKKVILVEINKPVAIFIDEIDKVLDLKFKSDDFFGLIRSFYNEKAKNPIFEHLSFILLGVARPEELIKKSQITPFNIGKAINLHGFSWAESLPLASGLRGKVDNPEKVIKEIISWTGGQPFLTQKVCQLILEKYNNETSENEVKLVEKLIKLNIIQNWEGNDNPVHLKTIKKRLLYKGKNKGRLLGLYQKILENGSINYDDSPEQIELRLTGLVVQQDGKLKPYNPIYKNVFNLQWVNEILDMVRPYAEYIHAWETSDYDQKWLLREEKLDETLQWSEGKSLSDLDYQYLNASRDLKIKETSAQIALEKERYLFGGTFAVLFITFSILFGGYISGYRPCLEENRIRKECFDFDISSGEEKIFRYSAHTHITKGIESFREASATKNEIESQQKYQIASEYFQEAFRRRLNDPVPKIFANNAKARAIGDPLKLAVVVPLNTEEDYSRMILRGVADAQDAFNKNGGKKINEHKKRLLEIVIANDASDTNLAKKVAEKLSQKNNGILGIVGHNSSDASKAAKDKYQKVLMAMISPAATSTKLTEGENEVFFRTVPSDKKAGTKLARYTKKQKLNNIVIFYEKGDIYSENLKKAFERNFDTEEIIKKDLNELQINNNVNANNKVDFDIYKIQNYLKQLKYVEVAVMLPGFQTRSVAIDIIRENALLSPPRQIKNLLGNDLMYSTNLLREARSGVEGLIVAVTWSRKTCYGIKAQQRWQEPINWRTAASYDATQAFIQAIKSSNHNPDRVAILNSLRKFNSAKNSVTNTSENPIWFGKKGESNRKSRLYRVVRDTETTPHSSLELRFDELKTNDLNQDCS